MIRERKVSVYGLLRDLLTSVELFDYLSVYEIIFACISYSHCTVVKEVVLMSTVAGSISTRAKYVCNGDVMIYPYIIFTSGINKGGFNLML